MFSVGRKLSLWRFGVLLIAAAGGLPPAFGAIIAIDANVSTTVQELIDGVPGSISTDSSQLGGDQANAPLAASGDLTSTDLDGILVSMGQAFGGYADPTLLDQPNPEEFALEVSCYANADSVSYTVGASAAESRTVVFTTPISSVAPVEIEFGPSLTSEIESLVFLSGAVIFWSNQSGQDLANMFSEFTISVMRDDTNDALFFTSLTVAGADASATTTTSDGPIRFETIGLDELADEGVDQETIGILQEVESNGTLIVVVIPPQEHAYTYRVRADESLVLRAHMEVRVRNIPGGTGVAATLGRPFENLADFIEQGLPGVDGAAVERSLNSVTARRAIGLVSDEQARPNDGLLPQLCGAFGFEFAALFGFGLVMRFGRSRR